MCRLDVSNPQTPLPMMAVMQLSVVISLLTILTFLCPGLLIFHSEQASCIRNTPSPLVTTEGLEHFVVETNHSTSITEPIPLNFPSSGTSLSSLFSISSPCKHQN